LTSPRESRQDAIAPDATAEVGMPALRSHRLAVAVILALALGIIGCRATINAADVGSSDASSPLHKLATTYFRNPMLSRVDISPNGENIAAVLARSGTEILIVKPTFGQDIRTLAKLERTRRKSSWAVRTLGWAGDTHLVASVEMPQFHAKRVRSRQSRLMVVPLEGGTSRYIGEKWRHQEYMGSQDNVVSWLHDEPDHILLSLWLPGQNGTGARKVNIRSGALSVEATPRYGTLGWAADHEGHVRAGWGERRSASEEFLIARTDPKGSFTEIARWDPADELGLAFAGFSPEPKTIYVYKRTEQGTTGVYTYDIEAQQLGDVVWTHPEYDVANILQSKRDRLLGVVYASDRPELHPIDKPFERLLAAIDTALPGRTNTITSMDHAERHAIVRSSSDTDPPTYYLLDVKGRELTLIFDAYPEAEKQLRHAEMKPVVFEARDGLPIPGYLTLPTTGKAPYPTLVIPHGGPWTRDVWGWDPRVQFLARRGFAVLQPNFRGSEGYGHEFVERGIGRWGLEMQDDITDGVDWLVAEGIADPDRLGIYGSSYGGFAALHALMKEPDKFKAGASFAGVTDVLTLLDDDKN
jgi:dipeptidyl aminopeptidase/acylaminoacyl peptidase